MALSLHTRRPRPAPAPSPRSPQDLTCKHTGAPWTLNTAAGIAVVSVVYPPHTARPAYRALHLRPLRPATGLQVGTLVPILQVRKRRSVPLQAVSSARTALLFTEHDNTPWARPRQGRPPSLPRPAAGSVVTQRSPAVPACPRMEPSATGPADRGGPALCAPTAWRGALRWHLG